MSTAKPGITIADLVDSIEIPVTLPKLYRDEQGQPITFLFTFRLILDGEATALEETEAIAGDPHLSKVRMLALLLEKEPEGFRDFPEDNGTALAQRAYAYFSHAKFKHIVNLTMRRYDRAALPAELFPQF